MGKHKEGTFSIWMDYWTKQEALYFIEDQWKEMEFEVKELINEGQWDRE